MEGKLVLIDGNSILNRAFYGVPDLTNAQGMHTNAVYGFLNIMLKILDEEKPEYLTVAFDVKHPTFRHEMYAEYKGTRKPMPNELREQMPLIKEVLSAMNINIVERAGYEADDILGTLAKRGEADGLQVSLVSGDRDLLQIATDNIMIRIPKTKKGGTEIENYHTADVIAKYSLTPAQIVDLKGLMGDASDNIPGVPGIGEKTAVKILTAFDTVENAIENIESVMPNKARESLREYTDMAYMSKTLATIKTDCELDFSYESARIKDMFNQNTAVLLKKLEFKSLMSRVNCQDSLKSDILDKAVITSDLSEAESFFNALNNNDTNVGFMFIDTGNTLGAALCSSKEKTIFIKCEGFISIDYLRGKLKSLIGNHLLVTFDIKKQLKFFDNDKSEYINSIIMQGSIFDVSIAAYLLNPINDTYNYDDIAKNYGGLILPDESAVMGKADKNKVIADYDVKCINIAIYSAYVAFNSYDNILQELDEGNMCKLMNDIELPLAHTLYDMEKRGIRVNRDELSAFSERLAKRISELELLIYDLAGEKFNISSPKQLGVILFEKLELPFAKKTKSGYSTSADILEKLRSEHKIINYILEYRQLSKLKSTYTDGLVNYIEDDEKIRSTFNQTITATGRISSTEPNLQNIPIRLPLGREIRKAFVPSDGYLFVDADYSQIELRVLAHMSQDDKLIEAYRSDDDIHKITASLVFHTPLNEVTKEQRSNAKAVNFGIVYGISSFGLGQDLNISRKEAEGYIKSYFETYPKIKEFLDVLVSSAKKNGYITTLFDRRRPVPELSSSNFMQRSFGERIAMNSPIQGTAADIIKIAMIRVNEKLRTLGLKSKLILQIHDELLIETFKPEEEQVKKLLYDEMFKAVNLDVALEVDVNTGNNWYDAK